MPEVPEHIQGTLAHLELDTIHPRRLSGLQSPVPIAEMPGSNVLAPPNRKTSLPTLPPRGNDNAQNLRPPVQLAGQAKKNGVAMEQPSFSPFPPLHNRALNVPPSDEEREAILENARLPVLNSNDPEMQLTWAQDALSYVEIATQNESRIAENQAPRPRTPQIEHQLRQDAVNIVSFLADQHHPKAEFIRGMWLEFGKFNMRMDKKEAFRCYSRAAQGGYARAEYRMGMQFEGSQDSAKAIKHYSLGVAASDSASMYRLGMMSLLGQHGQPQDYEKGVKLVRSAAESADENAPQGAYVFGMLQARELPQVDVPERYLPVDIAAARYHIEKAAYLGFAKAQTKMGAAYELCQFGCDFDPALSLHYNALASRQGEPDAEMAISKWFLCGYEGLFEKNEELAFVYARRAAQSGLATAEFAMGYFYEIGIYVPVNLKEAGSWYNRSSDHGNKDAMARIDSISKSKTLTKQDHENVAITRIKSQYGSQRGKRPDRFKKAPAPMPTISDESTTMPSAVQSRPRPPHTSSYPTPAGNGIPRPVSVAPYPVDDDPPLIPNPRPINPSMYTTPNLRPTVDVRPNSVATTGAFPPSSPKPPRAFASVENFGAGRGRGGPIPNAAPGAMGPTGYRQPSGVLPPTQSPRPSKTDPSRPGSAVDIGFSAPPDPTGADRRRRLQKSDNPNAGKLKPLSTTSTYEAANVPPPREPTRLSSLPQPGALPIGSRPNSRPSSRASSPHRPVSAGAPQSPIHSSTGPRPGSSMNLPSIPPKVPNSGRPTPSPHPQAAPIRPPGKGPKTFQEMGIPQSKQDSECVRPAYRLYECTC